MIAIQPWRESAITYLRHHKLWPYALPSGPALRFLELAVCNDLLIYLMRPQNI